MSQRPPTQFFEGTVPEAADQKWGNLQGSLCSYSQDNPPSSPPVRESHQKKKRVMPTAHCAQTFPQKCQLTVCIIKISVNYGYRNWHKLTRLPRANIDPGCRAVSRKFHTKLSVCPHPVNHTCQNARKHRV